MDKNVEQTPMPTGIDERNAEWWFFWTYSPAVEEEPNPFDGE